MAEKKTNETKSVYTPTENDVVHGDVVYIGANKKVNVVIPKEPGVKNQLPVYVNANGKTMLIDRGKSVTVSNSAAEILQEADRLRDVSDEYYTQVSQ